MAGAGGGVPGQPKKTGYAIELIEGNEWQINSTAILLHNWHVILKVTRTELV